ncbi:MAG: hypothetical protein JAY90_22350 [Candidatus Thiodiazotropha lotti]|nr:hypothetical protein [Candidatus Thiodiazotropha lotti]
MNMTKLSFHRRPMPIFANYRPLYKIAKLLLVLHISSRGGKSTLVRLQLFNWVLKESERKDLLRKAAKNGILNVSVWGLDPSLNSATQFALAEGLVNRSGSSIAITEKGRDYIKSLLELESLGEDVDFLREIGKGITESMVTKTSESWG